MPPWEQHVDHQIDGRCFAGPQHELRARHPSNHGGLIHERQALVLHAEIHLPHSMARPSLA